jgi:hypothetical protein
MYENNNKGFEFSVIDRLPRVYRDLINEYGPTIDFIIICDVLAEDLKSVDEYRTEALLKLEARKGDYNVY